MVELRDHDVGETAVIGVAAQKKDRDDSGQNRGEKVMAKLKTDHLNSEEKKSLLDLRLDNQNVFLLPGDKLSCTNAVRHSTQLEPGVTPINARPYRLPESQKEEVDRQVTQLLEGGIIAKNNYPWNSPHLVVPKKVGPDGKRKWHLVVDFRKLNEKTVGDAYPPT